MKKRLFLSLTPAIVIISTTINAAEGTYDERPEFGASSYLQVVPDDKLLNLSYGTWRTGAPMRATVCLQGMAIGDVAVAFENYGDHKTELIRQNKLGIDDSRALEMISVTVTDADGKTGSDNGFPIGPIGLGECVTVAGVHLKVRSRVPGLALPFDGGPNALFQEDNDRDPYGFVVRVYPH
ncbi:MAG: hypothetical protein AAFX08_10990 [Pseudomonadota bacterium]